MAATCSVKAADTASTLTLPTVRPRQCRDIVKSTISLRARYAVTWASAIRSCALASPLPTDWRPQYFKKLSYPCRMGRPGRGGDQVAVDVGVVEGFVGVNPNAAGLFQIGTQGRIGAAGSPAFFSGQTASDNKKGTQLILEEMSCVPILFGTIVARGRAGCNWSAIWGVRGDRYGEGRGGTERNRERWDADCAA